MIQHIHQPTNRHTLRHVPQHTPNMSPDIPAITSIQKGKQKQHVLRTSPNPLTCPQTYSNSIPPSTPHPSPHHLLQNQLETWRTFHQQGEHSKTLQKNPVETDRIYRNVPTTSKTIQRIPSKHRIPQNVPAPSKPIVKLFGKHKNPLEHSGDSQNILEEEAHHFIKKNIPSETTIPSEASKWKEKCGFQYKRASHQKETYE